MEAGLQVLQAVTAGKNVHYNLSEYPFGGAGIDQSGEPFPASTKAGVLAADAVLLSAIGGPKWDQATIRPETGLLQLRKTLGVFANLRPTVVNPALIERSPLKAQIVADTNFLMVRELTSGAYFGEPRRLTQQDALDTIYYSRQEIERVMKVGFQLAQTRKQHVTIVDKSNVLATSKLWRQVAHEQVAQFPNVTVDDCYVDAMAMNLLSQPNQFDVIITPNLFGDILSDEAAELTGSIGTIPSVSLGKGQRALYEPIHGSAPDIAGKGIANPFSMINTIALLLKHTFHRPELATKIDGALTRTIESGVVTPDLGGSAITTEVTQTVIHNLEGGA
ncbi:3-isopropylmalate dehydrogenase [Fructilactobacillus hinvesii]|uniref:3-isopropylmalate dehydrogenase n=2 Tax=Fructilactobacillus hinvesii TaxID=2940300 RepID=A0ABY5BTZ0_9LACO|nr:3-isopropylmalate dehydrogenase [Fructilactobacillus hinvesii]